MRRAARTDANHVPVMQRFREHGCSVEDTGRMGKGFPDLVIGLCGSNLLVEVKDGSKFPSDRKLTPDQVKWHGAWRGDVRIVKSLDDVDELVAKIRKRSRI